jgi:hypothetical protein
MYPAIFHEYPKKLQLLLYDFNTAQNSKISKTLNYLLNFPLVILQISSQISLCKGLF